jgi:branched-chain amino acid transport system permease protein
MPKVLGGRAPLYVLWAALLVAAVVLPLYLDAFRVGQLTQVLVTALAVMGLNLLTGFTGQVSVGHSAFFGVGAYVSAVASVELGTGPAVGVVLAVLAGALVGLLVGIPAQRIKGTHLALVTLIVAAAFPAVVRRLETWTGGSQGIRGQRISAPDGLPLAVDQWRYYVVLAVLLGVGAAITVMSRRPLGRALRAFGDHEVAAVTFGVRPRRLRLLVFALSAAITSLAGALFIGTVGYISPQTSYVTVLGSVTLLTALVIGGRAIVLGPLLGAAVAELVPIQVGQQSPELAHLLYGALIVVVLLVLPGGLTSLPDLVRRALRRRPRDPDGPAPAGVTPATPVATSKGTPS